MPRPTQDTAGVIVPPPLIPGAGLGLGLLLQRVHRLPILPGRLNRPVGAALIGLSGLLVGSAIRAMRRAGTEVRPDRPSTALVTDGPFRFSRNPIYLAGTLLYSGIATLANSGWPLLLLPVVLAVLQRGVIEREERYLERKFGDEYRRYRSRVRRWV